MNKTLLTIVLGCAVAAAAQNPAQPQAQPAPQSTAPAAQPQQAQPSVQPVQSAAPQQKKEIKDPAEYNAYVGAVQQSDPAAKISGLEAFLTQYPNSVMKEDALEILMGTYQQKGDPNKMGDTAQRLLQLNPNNVRALALLAYSKRVAAQAGQNPQQNLADAEQYGQKGQAALQNFAKPEGMSDADYANLKKQMDKNVSTPLSASLPCKRKISPRPPNRCASRSGDTDRFQHRLSAGPGIFAIESPGRPVNGPWFAARAAGIAPAQMQAQIEKYGKSQYTKYHGSDEGWTDVMAQAKASTTGVPPTASPSPYVPPSPADQAADLVKTKKVEEMSSPSGSWFYRKGSHEDVEKVWSVLKGKPCRWPPRSSPLSPQPT